MVAAPKNVIIYLNTRIHRPTLELVEKEGGTRLVPFIQTNLLDKRGRQQWLVEVGVPAGSYQFRIILNERQTLPRKRNSYYCTHLRTIWIQNGRIFNYAPPQRVSKSLVQKIDAFEGSLPTRPLYVYLPRGYHDNRDHHYPLLLMQDGQNCFQQYVADSYSGSWQADLVADELIENGQMEECIIVGVSHGGKERIAEYLPPYARVPKRLKDQKETEPDEAKIGRADLTYRYYNEHVLPYLLDNYRIKPGREHRALCGSSMGALFALYVGWHHAKFAGNIAALSTSFWITKGADERYTAIERLRSDRPRNIRLWLDSGTKSTPDSGDDGLALTLAARDALLDNGYHYGDTFQYHRADGAIHSESAWAERLHLVFRFLFPAR